MTLAEVEDGEVLTEKGIYERASGQFGGIESYAGFGDCDHLINVFGYEDAMTPLKGYYEESCFEKILTVAGYAYQCKMGRVGFCRHAFSSSLPDKTCQAIERESVYALDMDVVWFDFDLPSIEVEDCLEKLTPRLYQVFNNGESP